MAETLNDRYELGDLLGAGGMGRVHRARDLRLGRDVAVKILKGDRVDDASARARFLAEARTAGSLNHPGIATVHDVGEDRSGADGDPFMVMQLVEGVSVADVLRERGSLPPDAVERLLDGVADALAAAHAAGVVHRDVKPANILLSTDSRPVLVDFGIAIGAEHEPLTATGNVLGTVEYISPEQARGNTATGASDVYSLGLVAFQCLTGTSPFRRENAVASALAQVSEPMPPMPPSIPPHLARLVAAMTDKNPDARPTAAQVRDAVEARTAGETSVLHTVAAPVAAAGAGAPTSAFGPPTSVMRAEADDDRRRRGAALLTTGRSRAGVFGGAAALAVVVLLLGTLGAFGGDDEQLVPDVVGQSVSRATDAVEAVDGRVRTREVDEPGEKGEVLAQSPRAGAELADRGVVTLEVASGQVAVPDDLVGEPVDDATAALEELGFEVATTQVASSEAVGTVLAVSPTGTQDAGATITLSVAMTVQQQSSSGGGGGDPAEPKDKQPADPKDSKGPGGGGKNSGKGKGNP